MFPIPACAVCSGSDLYIASKRPAQAPSFLSWPHHNNQFFCSGDLVTCQLAKPVCYPKQCQRVLELMRRPLRLYIAWLLGGCGLKAELAFSFSGHCPNHLFSVFDESGPQTLETVHTMSLNMEYILWVKERCGYGTREKSVWLCGKLPSPVPVILAVGA